MIDVLDILPKLFLLPNTALYPIPSMDIQLLLVYTWTTVQTLPGRLMAGVPSHQVVGLHTGSSSRPGLSPVSLSAPRISGGDIIFLIN
jgi:hypothetical protein